LDRGKIEKCNIGTTQSNYEFKIKKRENDGKIYGKIEERR